MSWLFSQALVEEFSAATCSDGEPSAQLNVMPTPHKFSRQDKTMEPSSLSRFGLTCAVLTEDRGAALLTWYRAGFLARTSAKLETGSGSLANAPASGKSSPASFAMFDPDSSTWRTAQYSLLGGLESYSATWPNWGSMRNGESYLRSPWVPTTSANEHGLWQTPVADDAVSRVAGKWNSRGEPKLSAEVKLWPTPTRSDVAGGPGSSGRQGGLNLRTAVKRDAISCPGQLNPTWVEWLMNWPIGWTDLQPLPMEKFDEWRAKTTGAETGAEIDPAWCLRALQLGGNRPASSGPFPTPGCHIAMPSMSSESRCGVVETPGKVRGDEAMVGSFDGFDMSFLQEGIRQDKGTPDNMLKVMRESPSVEQEGWWTNEPDIPRTVTGVAHRVDRIKALGNGQVPRVAAAAFHLLSKRF